MPGKECPLCSETMQLKVIEKVDLIPGNPDPSPRTTREWVCPECDHFEEVEEEEK
jgi:acetone carboxylase gamma subunit